MSGPLGPSSPLPGTAGCTLGRSPPCNMGRARRGGREAEVGGCGRCGRCGRCWLESRVCWAPGDKWLNLSEPWVLGGRMWAARPDPSAWALTLLRTLGGFLPYPLLVLAVLPWLGSPAPLPLWPRRPPPHRGPAGVPRPPLLSRVGAAGLRERPLGCSSPRPRGSGSLQRMCSGDAEKTRPPARTRRPGAANGRKDR